MNYYRILDNLYMPKNRWFLGEIITVKNVRPLEFLVAKDNISNLLNLKISINIREQGIPNNITFTQDDIIVIDEKAAIVFRQIENVELIPVKINNSPSGLKYYILFIKEEIECVDEKNSVFDKWELNNDIRPDLQGNYKTIYKLKLLNEKINKNQSIFRIKKYDIAVGINEDLKNSLEKNNIVGLTYEKL